MLNQVVLVGRLTEEPTVEKVKDAEKCVITLAVQRNFKNIEGIYEIDKIKCLLFNSIASNTSEYCHKDDVVGVKGRIQVVDDKMEIIAEKVTFLSTRKESSEKDE